MYYAILLKELWFVYFEDLPEKWVECISGG